MFKYVLSFLIIFFSLNILIAEGLAVKTTSDTLSEGMRARIEAERTNKRFICQGELVCGVSLSPLGADKPVFSKWQTPCSRLFGNQHGKDCGPAITT
jgi:hypothetical protein